MGGRRWKVEGGRKEEGRRPGGGVFIAASGARPVSAETEETEKTEITGDRGGRATSGQALAVCCR